jgi:CubicO group peptidase (beta-lactamase class C family)
MTAMAREVDDAGLQELGQAVQQALEDTPVSGAVLGVDGPGGRWIRSVGHGLNADALLRLSSLTKPMVAAATLSAAQDGVLALTDPVDRWLPELAAPRVLRQPDSTLSDTVSAQHRLLVEDLLTMRLGTGFAYEQSDSAVARAAEIAQLGWGPPVPTGVPHLPDEWLARLAALPLLEQPGRWWRYGTAYSVLGVLLARAEGRSLPQVLHERVLGPLGMTSTAFHARPEQASRLVDCLIWHGQGDPGVLDPAAGSAWSQPPTFPDGAGGLLGTVEDVLAFGRALLDARAGTPQPGWLSAQTVRAMTTEQVPAEQRSGGGNAFMFLAPDTWGYGVALRTDDRGPARDGWAGGLGTLWYSYPDHDTVAVAVTQCVPPPMGALNAFFDGLDERLAADGSGAPTARA